MRTVCLYTCSDVSPNAIRSTHNPDGVYLSREPQHGNSGNHPEIIDGWCGTTNDLDKSALGEFDLNDAADFSALEKRVATYPVSFDREAILAWFNDEHEDDEDDGDYEFPGDGKCESAAFTWDENDEEFYGLHVRDGWQIVAGSDHDDDIECLTRSEQSEIDIDIIDWTEEVLKSANIDYDRQDHDTYSSDHNGRDWAYIAARNENVGPAESALHAAISAMQNADD